MGQSTWGVTPRNSFSRETRTQDKADGQLQKRIFVKSLCAHSEGTHITSLKSCPKCEPSLSLHLLQALQPSSNLVQPLQASLRHHGMAATRGLLILESSAEQGTSPHLLVVSSTARPALASSPGPASFSTRTTTSSAAVLSFPTTAATTTDEAQGRLSLLLTSSRMSSRMSKSTRII